MDEYYCTNCDATLNYQDGFDPDDDTWTCTECGQLLINDNIYDGEKFKGVVWYCDNCNTLLNRQYGFSDSNSTWHCTRCGHINEISEEKIGKNSSNRISDFVADIITTVLDTGISCYKQKKKQEAERARKLEEERIRSEKSEERKKKISLRRKRVKAFLFNKRKIAISHSYLDLVGKNISYVLSLLIENGFTNINSVSINDIYIDTNYSVGEVEQVLIDGSASFQSGDEIPYNTKITITYHEKKRIGIPFSSKSLKKKNHIYVCNTIKNLGFTEIVENPIKDLITGWITKAGSVEKVYIQNEEDFKKNDIFDYDEKITIEYHTFKK